MKSNHVLVVPYPAQGHVIPLMDAAQRFTRKGLKVTFVNTEDSHKRVVNACSQKDDLSDVMQMVAIPDGMEPWEDRNDLGLLTESMSTCERSNGSAVKKMPPMGPKQFLWACIGDPVTNKKMFAIGLEGTVAAGAADCIICNSARELEPETYTLFPKILPIGPLLATNEKTKQAGHFWNEDSSCVTWLDQQPFCSVIYVAFGSLVILNQHQFEELALGLDLINRPFLWVVRPGLSGSIDHIYPNGFMDRIGTRGKIVSWAPQQEVLNHPSVACFMSHCGWNSTMEGVSNGVPFLCWPYFYDQFLDATYICDFWKTGQGLNKDDTGIVTREEIKSKVEQLFRNDKIKQNALNLQERVMDSVKEGNSSSKNLSNFADLPMHNRQCVYISNICIIFALIYIRYVISN
uniref:UDP-glycosyltransferase 83A1-like n=1 Tax=Tanacetum cinerariifolium TaxID=118510 RepID=A0A699LAJ1_TANCI|nr:UDP-glycosyltransferase 83A1-like [Tanacetum cinerariifolium]